MILATVLAFYCTALPADTPRSVPAAQAVEAKTSADVLVSESAKNVKPDAPAPKISGSANEEMESSSSDMAVPSGAPIANVPVKPATAESYETPRKRAIWYGLVAAGHGAAALDAWTTRRAISSGYGVEADPLQRPFAHSNAIYVTTQLSPLVLDYVGHRMMRSRYPLLRRFWWLPQATGAGFSLGAGIHNYHVVP